MLFQVSNLNAIDFTAFKHSFYALVAIRKSLNVFLELDCEACLLFLNSQEWENERKKSAGFFAIKSPFPSVVFE